MSGPVRFGLVGAGAIAQTYAQALQALDSAQVVGVADVRAEAAGAMAEGLGCRAHAAHTELFEAELDAVVVATPPASHPGICVDFLERGVAVLCEKPLCVDLASAERMVAAAEKHGALLTMASKFRFVEDVVRARSILSSGILGEVMLFENAFTARVDMSKRWNSQPDISGGGVLIDNGTHSLDVARYLLGPIREVLAIEGKRAQGLPVEDTVTVFFRTHEDVTGTIDLSWAINKELETFIDIYGTNGTVRVGWRGSRYRQSSSREWVPFGEGYSKLAAFQAQIQNFVDALRGADKLRIGREDALASVRVMEAAYASLRTREWVAVP